MVKLRKDQLPLEAVRAMQKAMTMPGIDARTLLKIGLDAWSGAYTAFDPHNDECLHLPLPTEARDD
jgi:hypothetical protein